MYPSSSHSISLASKKKCQNYGHKNNAVDLNSKIKRIQIKGSAVSLLQYMLFPGWMP